MHRRHRSSIQKALAAFGVMALVVGAASVVRATERLLASPSAVIEGAPGDAVFGYSVASAGDVNGDGYDDVIVGAPQYSSTQTYQGAAFVFHGGPDGIAGGDWSSAATLLEGPDGYGEFYFGYGVAGAGDVNGDGYDDVIVTNPANTFLYLGGPGGIPSGNWSAAAALLNGGFTGHATGVGDVNGDGYDDIAATTTNGIFVVHGGPGGIAAGRYSSVASTSLVDAQGAYGTDWTVSGAGDTNGDGYDDVIVGADFYDAGQLSEGVVFVFLGSPAGISSGGVASAPTVLHSDQASAAFGGSVDGAGDVNGDGYDDVVIGASGYEYGSFPAGAAFVFHGGPNGVPSALASAAPTILPPRVGGGFGAIAAGAGDVNGDGFDDVVVDFFRSPWADPSALVYLGASTGTSLVAAGTLGASEEASIAGAGDVNGDGYDDVIVGAYSYPNETYTGRAVVYQGGVDEWKLLAYDYNSLWGRTAKIGEAYDYSALKDYPTGFGPFTHVASGPRYTFFYNSSTGGAGLATVSTSGVVTTVGYWGPGKFGPGWTHVVWHGDNLFFYCQGNGLAAVGRFEGPTFTFHQYNAFTLSPSWSHVVSVQGYLLLYRALNGAAYASQLTPVFNTNTGELISVNLRYVRAQTFSTGWTHIVDSQHGVLFYNGSNGGYRVGDFDGTGYLTTRTAPWPAWSAFPLWKYTTQRAGWTSVVASGDRLLFYDKSTGEGVTGYVRTTAESNAEQAEPLARMQTYGWGSLSYPGEQKWSHIVPVAPW